MPVDYLSLISKHTAGHGKKMVPAFIIHSALVTRKALEIAESYMQRTGEDVDLRLLEEMGMLHDIGIFHVNLPIADLYGQDDYVAHFTHGHRILTQEGLPRHASAAKNHSNIPTEEIKERDLPLPHEDHTPQTVEEEILSLADTYYSKFFDSLFHEYSDDEIRKKLAEFSSIAVQRFDVLRKKYMDF